MALFGGAKKTTSIPTDQVIKLRQQNLSDEQIVTALQKDGFKSHQIFEAMHQADVKGTISPTSLEQAPEPEKPMIGPLGGTIPPPPRTGAPIKEEMSKENIQEIAEAIIDEKWNELVVNVNKIIDWKEEVDKKIAQFSKILKAMEEKVDAVQASTVAKIEESKKSMSEMETDMAAFKKVFKKVLPDLVERASTPYVQTKKTVEAPEIKPKKTKKNSSNRNQEIFGSTIEDIT